MQRLNPNLRLEELGGRVVPSAAALTTPVGTTAAHVGADTTPAAELTSAAAPARQNSHTQASDELHGAGGGDYAADGTTSTGGRREVLHGDAYLAGLGQVSVTGTVWTVGTVGGHAGAELTFANGRGSVTVNLYGPEQAASSGLPSGYAYRVLRATGAYADVQATGEARLHLSAGDFAFQLGAGAEHHHVQSGAKLDGVGGGDYLTGAKTSEGGTESRVYGQAFLNGFGGVSVSGSVWTVGKAKGQAGGVLTFRNAHGSVTVALDGPDQKASSGLPGEFHYEVIEGTGAYANFRKTGELGLHLDPSQALGGKHRGGGFTLRI